MVKRQMAYVLSAAATIAGAFSLFSGNSVFAYNMDGDFAIPVGNTDEELYNDLKSAIADGKNVKLNSDIEHYVQISGAPSIRVDHSMTLDLNGYKLATASTSGGSAGNTGIAVSGEGTILTINDTSTDKTGAIRYDHKGNAAPSTLWIGAGAKVVLNDGSIISPYGRASANGEGIAVNMKGEGASFEMNGGGVYSHEDSTSTSNYGVRFNSNGNLKVTRGTIETVGNALSGSKAVNADVTGGTLVSTSDEAVLISSTSCTGSISNIPLKDAVIAGQIELTNLSVTDLLELRGGTRNLTNVSAGSLVLTSGTTNVSNTMVNGLTTVGGGNATFGEGVSLAGGLVYQAGAATILTIHDGTSVAGFSQLGKVTNASYTDSVTKEKVSVSYNAYGGLVIDGGTFTGDFSTVLPAQVEEANTIRREYVDSYNEHSGKTPLVYSDVAILPTISGGEFATKPDNSVVIDGYDIYDVSPDGPYYVEQSTVVDLPEKLYLRVGDTYDTKLSEVAKKYGRFGGASDLVAVDDEGVMTALAKGSGLVNFQLHNYKDPVDDNIDVTVYDIESREGDASEDAADEETIEDFFAGQVKEALENRESGWYHGEKADIDVSALKDAFSSAGSLMSGLIINLCDEEDAEEHTSGYEEIMAELNGDEKVIAFYNVSVSLSDENYGSIGFANTLDKPITLRFAIPEEYAEAEGEFSVLRSHLNRGTDSYQVDRMSARRDGNDLLVENDQFSTFAIAYSEKEEEPSDDEEDDGGEAVITDETKTTGKESATAPESGTMTAAGASASAAALVTAVIIGLLTTVTSFVFLMRRR